jgi:hypothetical protein
VTDASLAHARHSSAPSARPIAKHVAQRAATAKMTVRNATFSFDKSSRCRLLVGVCDGPKVRVVARAFVVV